MAEGGTGDDVNVRFGASIDDLKSKLGEVQGIFGEVTKRFAAMAAVVAGGAAFKDFIDETNKLNSEAMKLSRTLGITGDEAGTLNTALGDIYSDADTYTGAFLKFNRALRSSGDEMRALGIDIDGLKTGQKTSNEIFMQAIGVVAQYKPGIDQSQIAMKLFGRSIEDVMKLQKLNAQVLEDARKKNQELNLTITQEGVDASKRYKAAMNDVGDVLTGLKKTIGEAVIPLFSESAEQLASIGPALVEGMRAAMEVFVTIWRGAREVVAQVWSNITDALSAIMDAFHAAFGGETISAMEVFKNALRLVLAVFVGLRVGIQESVVVIRTMVLSIIESFRTLGEVAAAAFSLDWDGVKDAYARGFEKIKTTMQVGMNTAAAVALKGREDIDEALSKPLSGPSGTSVGAPKGGTKTANLDQDSAAAAARLNLQRTMQEAALSLEKEYLTQAQSIYDDAYKLNLIDTRSYYEAKQAIELRALDASIDVKRREAEEAAKQANVAVKAPDRLKFQAEEQKLLGEINVLEAKRNETVRANAQAYENAERERLDALNTIRANRTGAAVEAGISMERGAIEQMRALREIDADQALEMQRSLEQRSYAATQAGLAAKAQLIRGDAVKQAQFDAEAEAAEQQHQLRLVDIDRQASAAKRKFLVDAQKGAQDAFATALNQLMGGVTKLSDVLRNFALNLTTTFQNLIAQKFAEKVFDVGGNKLMDWIVTPIQDALSSVVSAWFGAEEAKTLATEAGTAVRTTAEEGAASESLLLTAATAVKRIAIAAWEAAASVYASIAAIPYVGPFLAPAMAVAAGAAVIGFASHIASAEGGWWQVPSDQVAQIHKDEMVMPAAEAQGIREMVSGGRTGGQAMNVNISALDGRSVAKLFMENGPALAKSLQNQARNFRGT